MNKRIGNVIKINNKFKESILIKLKGKKMTTGCQTSCWISCCAPIRWICQCFSTSESNSRSTPPAIPEAVEAIQNVGSNVASQQQPDPTHNRTPTRSWKLVRVGSMAAMSYAIDTPTARSATNETVPT